MMVNGRRRAAFGVIALGNPNYTIVDIPFARNDWKGTINTYMLIIMDNIP